MANRLKAIALMLAAAIAILATRSGSPAAPLLSNGGFEGGWHKAAVFWTPAGGPYHYEFGEITPPEGWTAWWREGFPCSGTDDWHTGRPEVRVIPASDPARIHSGEQAVQWFTFWKCHHGGLLQQVTVEEGHYYSLRAYGHSWFSNCSHRPHDAPYDYDCSTPIGWAQNWLSVGIDSTGGIDPMASSVVWGEAREIYGVYDGPLAVDHVQVQAVTVTMFLRSVASHPLKHVDFYIDDVTLTDCTYRTFLPFVRLGQGKNEVRVRLDIVRIELE